jgi:uncharacterized protein involved in exopolysaccharide biosynthesis
MREHAEDISVLEYWRGVRQDWRWFVGITAAAAVASVAVALLLPQKFLGEVVIVEAQQRRSGGASTAMLGNLGGLAGLAGIDLSALGESSASARAVLNSRMLVEEFISRNNLLPILFSDDWDATTRKWTTAPDATPTLWLGVKQFIEDIREIEEDSVTGVIRVTAEWEDPELASAWANGLVKLANQIVRTRDLTEAERSVAYLQSEITKTNILGLQQVLYSLIETEMQTIMLAKVKEEYAFEVIDPAVAPELRSFPHRALVAAIGTTLGGFIALMVILVRLVIRREEEGRGLSG